MFLQIYRNKRAQQRKIFGIYFVGTIIPSKYVYNFCCFGLFCYDKFEETTNKKVSGLPKLSESYFSFIFYKLNLLFQPRPDTILKHRCSDIRITKCIFYFHIRYFIQIKSGISYLIILIRNTHCLKPAPGTFYFLNTQVHTGSSITKWHMYFADFSPFKCNINPFFDIFVHKTFAHFILHTF